MRRLRDRARQLKCEVVALWIAARDPRCAFAARAVAAFVLAYSAFSTTWQSSPLASSWQSA